MAMMNRREPKPNPNAKSEAIDFDMEALQVVRLAEMEEVEGRINGFRVLSAQLRSQQHDDVMNESYQTIFVKAAERALKGTNETEQLVAIRAITCMCLLSDAFSVDLELHWIQTLLASFGNAEQLTAGTVKEMAQSMLLCTAVRSIRLKSEEQFACTPIIEALDSAACTEDTNGELLLALATLCKPEEMDDLVRLIEAAFEAQSGADALQNTTLCVALAFERFGRDSTFSPRTTGRLEAMSERMKDASEVRAALRIVAEYMESGAKPQYQFEVPVTPKETVTATLKGYAMVERYVAARACLDASLDHLVLGHRMVRNVLALEDLPTQTNPMVHVVEGGLGSEEDRARRKQQKDQDKGIDRARREKHQADE